MIGGTCKVEALFLAEECICMDTLSVLFRKKKEKKKGLIDGKSKSFYHLKMQNDHWNWEWDEEEGEECRKKIYELLFSFHLSKKQSDAFDGIAAGRRAEWKWICGVSLTHRSGFIFVQFAILQTNEPSLRGD